MAVAFQRSDRRGWDRVDYFPDLNASPHPATSPICTDQRPQTTRRERSGARNRTLIAADIDGDTHEDIVVAFGSRVFWLRNRVGDLAGQTSVQRQGFYPWRADQFNATDLRDIWRIDFDAARVSGALAATGIDGRH